jgi:transposase InsO family protein
MGSPSAKRRGISRNLVRIWAAKAEAGEFDDDLVGASILQEYEARIGAARRGQCREPQESDAPDARARSNRTSAQAFCATTDSDHDGLIFPNLAKDVVLTDPNQLWVVDITYIAIAVGFVYLAATRRGGPPSADVSMLALALVALKAAIASRQPPIGCIHHSDRGSRYAAEDYRAELEKHGLKGSMGQRGNPHAFAHLGRPVRSRDNQSDNGGFCEALASYSGYCRQPIIEGVRLRLVDRLGAVPGRGSPYQWRTNSRGNECDHFSR